MQGPQLLNGWHVIFDATSGLWRLAELRDGVVLRWGSQPASKPPETKPPETKTEAPKVEKNYGVNLEELRKEKPLGWTVSKGAHFVPPVGPEGGPQIVAGQQVNWPTLEQARPVDLAPYVAPGVIILSALWLLLHSHKGKR